MIGIFIVAGATKLFACDICGCSASAYSMGIMRNYNSHFIALRYNNSSYQSTINHSSAGDQVEHAADMYQRYELMGRISFNEKLKMVVSLPFLANQMQEDTGLIRSSGLGDPLLLMQYRVFGKSAGNKNQVLFLGAGPKFPLGKFDQAQNGVLVNPNFQLGSGSVDLLVNANYLFQRNKNGFTIESSYKVNTSNNLGYRFGNIFNTSVNYFYATGKNKVSSVFYTGGIFEKASPHFSNDSRVFNTGSTLLVYNGGFQLYYSRVRLGAGVQCPVYQKFRTDNLTSIHAGLRFNADLVFFLK